MERREFIATAGALGSTALAGCVSSPADGGADVEVSPPTVNNITDDWEVFSNPETTKFGEFQIAGFGVEAYGNTIVYTYLPVKERMDEYTGGTFQTELVLFFVSHVELFGVDELVPDFVFDRVIKQSLRDQVGDYGVERIEEADTLPETIETNSGATATRIAYRGEFIRDNVTAPLPLPDGGSKTVNFGTVRVPIQVRSAYWRDGKDMYIAGGAYPLGDISEVSNRFDIRGGYNSGIDARVYFNFDFETGQYERETQDMIKKVS